MPLDAVAVLVVEHGQACLVVPLLKVLHSQANGVGHALELAGLIALKVVGLRTLQPNLRKTFRYLIVFLVLFTFARYLISI